MLEYYEIIKEGTNKYVFTTKENIEYQLVIRPSGITYKSIKGEDKNVLELALNCDTNTASKDYKTIKTLAAFCTEMSLKYDAIYIQIHNQPEVVNNNKTERRGLSRIKLWNRVISKYFNDYILLTNLVLSPNSNSDILSIVIKKDSTHFKDYVTNFYRFCHHKMYPTI
tara:strand:+ start:967 stop:1470 length:504 start_codon:yes stop_codon:yes gene_type:complete